VGVELRRIRRARYRKNTIKNVDRRRIEENNDAGNKPMKRAENKED
jgi:hypothetical protein